MPSSQVGLRLAAGLPPHRVTVLQAQHTTSLSRRSKQKRRFRGRSRQSLAVAQPDGQNLGSPFNYYVLCSTTLVYVYPGTGVDRMWKIKNNGKLIMFLHWFIFYLLQDACRPI